jgi:hypothetical protein
LTVKAAAANCRHLNWPVIGLESKTKSGPFLNSYCVVLLKHYMLIRKLVVPRKDGRLDSVTGSVVEYIILKYREYMHMYV